ncbi:TlpA disulfide reductase family protein [Acidiphilium acidophilum]|uniref:TlpA family protein disulfide reductase n=1 Tax=Acidiphilium acidophilum TaxID=76588 RepID=UPI002E8E6817|nr:TlpA disulfide reductase family protein [Acidiphilium acidophilum]
MPIVISLGGLLIQTPRLVLFVFAAMTIWLTNRLGKRWRVSDGALSGRVERMFLIGVLGARVAYVAKHFSAYRPHILNAFFIWQPGYTPWAGFAFGLAYLGWLMWRRRISLPQLRVIAFVGIPLTAFYLGSLATVGRFGPADRLHPGGRLPSVGLMTLNGRTVNLSDLRGRPAVVNIWATWCLPCREEMPMLSRTFATRQKGGFAMVGVDLAEPARRVRQFLAAVPVRYPVWVDPPTVPDIKARSPSTGLFARTGGFAVPTTIFIDRKGIIRSIYVGKLTATVLAIKLAGIGAKLSSP